MKKRYCALQIVLVLFALVLIFPIMVFATNINTIIQQMERSYQKQMSQIQDITIVQEMDTGFFDFESTTYQKKARVNNQDIFKSRTEATVMGMNTVTIYDGFHTWSIDPASGEVQQEEGGMDPLQAWKMFDPDKTEYLGEEEVNGKNTYKVRLEDAIWMMGQENLANQNMSEDMDEMEMESIYWIDKNDFVPLKSKNFMKVTTVEDGKPVNMNTITDIQFLDYRLVGSMLIPHRLVISTQMEIDDPSLSQEEKEMAQSMMGAMGMGSMEMTVKSAKINTGLSDALFDGTKLEAQEPMFGGLPNSSQGIPGSEQGEPMAQEDMKEMMEGLMDMMEGNEEFQEMMKNMMPSN